MSINTSNLAKLVRVLYPESTIQASIELKGIIKAGLDDVQALIVQNKELSETNKKIRQVLVKQSQDIVSGKIDGEHAQVILDSLMGD